MKDTARLENGSETLRELVIHSGGVCVVPLTADGRVAMVKQFRYPFKEVLLEIPAGKLEEGEDRYEAAMRELMEETGAVCDSLEYLGVMYPSVAFLNEKIYMYLARGIRFVSGQSPDEDEFLDLCLFPLSEVIDMIMKNEIKDAKTQTAILKAHYLSDKN
jgi:ADP-ribose pyrophosphatase